MSASPDRSFSVEDLIQLPRFDARGAVGLGERLLEVAGDSDQLPRPIGRARDALAEDLAALRAAAAARLAAVADPEKVSLADRALDACWTALFEWLTGFSKLPEDTAESDEARALLRELYPDGLSFILLPYELEWSQSDLRLTRLLHEPVGERVRRLGGACFIEALGRAHQAYGQILGLPRSRDQLVDVRLSLHEALETFASTLRVYALKVTAYVEVDQPETAALAKRLLAPLLSYRGSRTGADPE